MSNLQWQFGTTPNYLAALVLAGKKTATCSGKIFYELENAPFPQVDERAAIVGVDRLPKRWR